MPYAPREVLQVTAAFAEAAWRENLGPLRLRGCLLRAAQNWYADTYLAIDQGPIIVMMENYRTGLLWKLFMSVPEVRAGLARLQFKSPHLEACGLMESTRRVARIASTGTRPRRCWRASPRWASSRRAPGSARPCKPKRGSIVASPVLAAYDPDPDYFFHWFRDSAVVVDAIRLLYEAGTLGAAGSLISPISLASRLSLEALDGRKLVAAPAWRKHVAADFTQYVRDDARSRQTCTARRSPPRRG